MSDRPPLEYLAVSSEEALSSFELSRLSHASNLRKRARHVLEQVIQAEAEARFAGWLVQCRKDDTGFPAYASEHSPHPALPPIELALDSPESERTLFQRGEADLTVSAPCNAAAHPLSRPSLVDRSSSDQQTFPFQPSSCTADTRPDLLVAQARSQPDEDNAVVRSQPARARRSRFQKTKAPNPSVAQKAERSSPSRPRAGNSARHRVRQAMGQAGIPRQPQLTHRTPTASNRHEALGCNRPHRHHGLHKFQNNNLDPPPKPLHRSPSSLIVRVSRPPRPRIRLSHHTCSAILASAS